MRCALLLALIAPAMALAATVETLDGERLIGASAAVLAESVAITPTASGAEPRRIRLADAHRIDFGAPAWRPADALRRQPPRPGGVEAVKVAQPTDDGVHLADGGWLPGRVLAAERPDHVVVDGAWGRFLLPLAAVRAWGRPPLDGGTEDELTQAGGSVRGRILGLRDGRLAFRSPLTPDPIPVADVVSLAMAVPTRPPRGLTLWHQARADRPPLTLVRRVDGWSPAAAVSGTVPEPPWLRVESPRRLPLSELAPAEVVETGAFGVVWPWRRDRDLDGEPLRLGGIWRQRGLSVHSAATMSWQLTQPVVRLRAELGIADAVAPEGDCVVVLASDRGELGRYRLRGTERPIPLDLDLSGARRLTLVVELGERYDIGDHVVLADAALIRPR